MKTKPRAYLVLSLYPSRSGASREPYQVRRGGDGVLYCTCRGWVASKKTPRRCRHTEDYVAQTGTAYFIRKGEGRFDLVVERDRAVASSLIAQDAAALAAYAFELDL